MTSKEQIAEQISAENRAADARITMRRGGGQSEPTTPSGIRKMWKPPTRGTTRTYATSTAGFLYRCQRLPSF